MVRVSARDDVAALTGYLSRQIDVPVRLNTNESPFGPPPAWLDEYVRSLRAVDWNRYPDRDAARLRSAIAALHGVDTTQVFAANGSNEVLQSLLLAYGGPGRTVATFEPSYQLHRHIAGITGATVVTGERDADFSLDAGEVVRVAGSERPDVMFLCSPNNPTGNAVAPDVLDAAIDHAPGVLVVDEAYGQFTTRSALARIDDERPLAVVRTYSKTWGLAALRLGYLVAPAWLVAELYKVALPYHLDTAKQLAGTLALRYVDEMNDRVAAIVDERERLTVALAALDVDVFPSEANFVLFRPRSRTGHDVWQALVDRGVLVRDCSSWPRLRGCLRVTVGTRVEDDAFLEAMAAALAKVPA